MIEYDDYHHEWELTHISKEFRVYSVQPNKLTLGAPSSRIFNRVFNYFASTNTSTEIASGNTTSDFSHSPKPFNLLTFPEAFLPHDAFVEALRTMADNCLSIGCIHTGITPNNGRTHLFQKEDIDKLLIDISKIINIENSDLNSFKNWYQKKFRLGDKINLAAFFVVDSFGKLRICLHAKMARSKFEESLEEEKHMREVHLIQTLTLKSSTDAGFSLNILPLICSDFTNNPQEEDLPIPVKGANDILRKKSINFDLISVVNCTPIAERGGFGSVSHFRFSWKHQFLSVIEEMCRAKWGLMINNSCIVFTNSNMFESEMAGLTGGFIRMSRINSLGLKLQIEGLLQVPHNILKKICRDVNTIRWENIDRLKEIMKADCGVDKPEMDIKKWEAFGMFIGLPVQEKSDVIISYSIKFPRHSGTQSGLVTDAFVMDILSLEDGDKIQKR